jgi:hypothetical protein
LHADARDEGREAHCPECSTRTGIPRWSNVPAAELLAEIGDRSRYASKRSATSRVGPNLSIEEIEFLRGMETGNPEAAA